MSFRSRSRDRYESSRDDRHREEPRRDDRYDDRRDDHRREERRDDDRREPKREQYDDRRSPVRRSRSPARRSRTPPRRSSRSPEIKRVSRDANGAPVPAPPSTCVGVFGLHRDTTQKEFEYQMGKFGRIAHVVLVWNHRERCNKGFGFITYDEQRDAEVAVKEMNGRTLDGRTVRVDFSFSKVGNKEHMYDDNGRRKTEYCDPEYRKPRYDTPPRMQRRSRSRSYERRRSPDRRRRSRDRY